jgi:hypothetical protein
MLPIIILITFLISVLGHILEIVWEPFMVLIPYAFYIIISIFIIFILGEIINKNLSKKYVEISTQTDDLPVESSTQTNYIKSDSESDSDTVSYYDSDSDYSDEEYDYAEKESDYSEEEEEEEEEEYYMDKYGISFITD